MRGTALEPGTIENILDNIDTIVNPTYATPAPKNDAGRGSGRQLGPRGLPNRTGRQSGSPPGGGNQFSSQGGVPFATGGPISQGGSSPPTQNRYGFDRAAQAGQVNPPLWRPQAQGAMDHQIPRLVQIFVIKTKGRRSETKTNEDRAQSPVPEVSLPQPPPPVADQVDDLVYVPPSPTFSMPSPVYSEVEEEKASDTESDSGSGCMFPGRCAQHPAEQPPPKVDLGPGRKSQNPTHPKPIVPTTSPHTAMRVQGMVTTPRAATAKDNSYEVIELE